MSGWEVWAGGGSAGTVVIFFTVQYLKSVNVNLKALVNPIEKLQDSISQLNIKIATIIADTSNDRERVRELEKDMKKIQANCKSCTNRS